MSCAPFMWGWCCYVIVLPHHHPPEQKILCHNSDIRDGQNSNNKTHGQQIPAPDDMNILRFSAFDLATWISLPELWGKLSVLPPQRWSAFRSRCGPNSASSTEQGILWECARRGWWWWCFFSAALKNWSNTHGTQQDSDVFFGGCIRWFVNLLLGGIGVILEILSLDFFYVEAGSAHNLVFNASKVLPQTRRKLAESHLNYSEFRFVKYRISSPRFFRCMPHPLLALHCDLISDIVSVSICNKYPVNLPTKDHEKISFQSLSSNKKTKITSSSTFYLTKTPTCLLVTKPNGQIFRSHFTRVRVNPVYCMPIPMTFPPWGIVRDASNLSCDPRIASMRLPLNWVLSNAWVFVGSNLKGLYASDCV